MITSCQPRPQPHSSGMAATSAASGMATNRPTRKRWNAEFGSSAKSDLAGRGSVLVVPPTGPAGAGAVGAVAGSAVVAVGRDGARAASAALTVSGDVVIVLLWFGETGRSACTLT